MLGVRITRRRVLLLAASVAVVAVVLWLWHPWQRPITIVEGVNPSDGATMVWVPAGTFRMGTGMGDDLRDAAGRRRWREMGTAFWDHLRGDVNSDEAPSRTVYLDGYWMYKHPVTVAQYRAFCAATGRALPAWPGDELSWAGTSGWDDPALQQHPIVNVYWDDATAYAAWAGVSLPTEAQWEKAARGTDGRLYPWGNTWDATKCANVHNSAYQDISTWPVGSFPAGVSPYGAHDMAGHVWEWCADWYGGDYYRVAPSKNPPGPASGGVRVLRGGSWIDYHFRGMYVEYVGHIRCAYRYCIDDYLYPRNTSSHIGFRCVSFSPGP